MKNTTWMLGALLALAGCGVSTGGGTGRDGSTDVGGGGGDAAVRDGSSPGTDSGGPTPDAPSGPDAVGPTSDSGGGMTGDVTVMPVDGGPGPGPDGGPRPDGGPGLDGGGTVEAGVRDCRSSMECGTGFRCATRGCEGTGTCVLVPPVCTSERVCGCDGRTYESTCAADAVGVRVASTGPCSTTTVDAGGPDAMDAGPGLDAGASCRSNDTCGRGQWCSRPAGMCSAEGSCRPITVTACPTVFRPVCGCDGRTYGNSCEAEAGGMSVATDGACPDGGVPDASADVPVSDVPVSTRCTANDQCGRAAYCQRATGACDGAGACVVRPTACTRELAPVCGCDGTTYSNPCMAQLAGVSVSYSGECRATLTCRSNGECGAGRFCQRDVGACTSAGVCAAVPDLCTRELAPVCGCDGTTYSNSCLARQAGASVSYAGECRTACMPARGCCGSDSDCLTGGARIPVLLYCVGGSATCTGVCKSRPTERGQCWRDSDCSEGLRCTGASICPCNAACLIADRPGTCAAVDF